MTSSSRLAAVWRDFHARHERLKKTIHEGFRYPLPRWGRWMMGGVYFAIPIVGGWCVMQWAISKSHASIGVQGERLPLARQMLHGDEQDEFSGGGAPQVLGARRADGTAVGAGGWGGGVRLAKSDEDTQRRNREKLDKFLRRQQKLAPKRQAEGGGETPVETAAG